MISSLDSKTNIDILNKIEGKTIRQRMKKVSQFVLTPLLVDEIKLVSIQQDLSIEKKIELLKDKFKQNTGLVVDVDSDLVTTFNYEEYLVNISIKRTNVVFSANKN